MVLDKLKGAILMKVSKVLMVLGSLTLVASVTACGTSTPTKAAASKHYTIYAFEPDMAELPFSSGGAPGLKAAARKYRNLTLRIEDGQGDPATQATEITDAIATHPSAMIIDPVTSAGEDAAIRAARAAGIPVFIMDRELNDPSLAKVSFVAHQFAMGRAAVQYDVKYLQAKHVPTPWNVVVLQGQLGVVANTRRTAGDFSVLNPLIKQGKVHVVANEPANWSSSTAVKVMGSILTKTHNIQLIVASNDGEATGVKVAMATAGLTLGHGIYMSGNDGSPAGVAMIQKGIEIDSPVNPLWLEAYWAVEGSMQYLQHGTLPSSGSGSVITLPTSLVNPTNVSTYGPYGEPKNGVAPKLPY